MVKKINLTETQLERFIEEAKPLYESGKLADYIPALAQQDKADVAVTVYTDEEFLSVGTSKKFTIQSISKIITLAIALEDFGPVHIFQKVGMEPTEETFNSVANLQKYKKPINPMVNAGALTITNMIKGDSIDEKMERILQKTRKLAHNPSIDFNSSVAQSEYETASINRALCYLLEEYQLIEGSIESLLKLYTMQCAIEIDTRDLAQIASVLANGGSHPKSKEKILSKETVRIINTIMLMCGMYNVSGNFAMNVGFPAKSGVSGALIGVVPHVIGIGIYGPSLNEYGNSIVGTKIMELLAERFSLYLL